MKIQAHLLTALWLAAVGLMSRCLAEQENDLAIKIEVIGAYRDADIRYLAETVATFFPDKLDSLGWSASGNRFGYKASPVADVDAVAKKITFGKVSKLDETTLRVIFDCDTEVPARFHKGTANFIPHPRDQLGGTLKRFKGSWWSALEAMRIDGKWTKQRKLVGLEMPSFKTTDETLKHLAELTSLEDLDLSMNRHVTDEGARHLASLTNLESLDLFGTHIGNHGQSHLKNLTKLKTLKLSGLGTEDGLRHLAGLTGLEELSIGYGSGYPVTPAGLQHLKGMKNLKRLRLDGCEVSDGGLAIIAAFSELEHLGLQGGAMTDIGLAHLSRLVTLRTLNLKECTKVTDAGLAHLSGLTELRSLNISNTSVTEQGLWHLEKAKNLNRIRADDSGVTREAIEKFTQREAKDQ